MRISCIVSAAALVSALCLSTSKPAFAVLVINTQGQVDTENFNLFAGTALSIPANFAYSGSDFTPGGIYDATGAFNGSNSTYALRLSDANERAFGAKLGASEGPFTLSLTLSNNTGSDISQFLVAWAVEQYSESQRATTIDFNYNSNGGGVTQANITGVTLTTATTNASADANLASIASTSRSATINLATPLGNGQQIILGWVFTTGVGSDQNAHIGIDDLVVTSGIASAVPEASSFLFGGLACCAVGATVAGRKWRRRKTAVAI